MRAAAAAADKGEAVMEVGVAVGGEVVERVVVVVAEVRAEEPVVAPVAVEAAVAKVDVVATVEVGGAMEVLVVYLAMAVGVEVTEAAVALVDVAEEPEAEPEAAAELGPAIPTRPSQALGASCK